MARFRDLNFLAALLLALNCAIIYLPVNGFNMDLQAPIVQQISDLDSYFGFSVAMHRENGENMILVGAPTYQTANMNVNKSGAIFSCPVAPLTGPPACQERMEFDGLSKDVNEVGQPVATQDNQWFGATVKSSGEDGIVLACRPRYTWYTGPESPGSTAYRKREPIGGCFVARNNFTNILKYEPCRTSDTDEQSVFGITHCQAGMDADITNDQILLGAPGSFFWQGQIWVSNTEFTPSSIMRTNEGKLKFDDSYRGYSVAMADFKGDSQPEYAIGVPRGSRLLGVVSIFDAMMNAYLNITGTQVGAYFGYTLAVSDLNNDGLNDIVVGAPFFIDEEKTRDGWEIGRVHIYYNDGNGGFSDGDIIVGYGVGSRFGSAIAALSDINQDGYNDMAISAPYGGTDNAGSVYIYHGTGSRGLSRTYSQVLEPSSFGLDISTFGFALSAGLDMDNNNYPDLAIGAYRSATVVLVRSRPIISVTANLFSLPDTIALQRNASLVGDVSALASFNLSVCITYTGNNVPSSLDVQYTTVLDYSRTTTGRVLFVLPGTDSPAATDTMNLAADVQTCMALPAYVKASTTDKLSPIGVSLNFGLADTTPDPGQILPILDESVSTYRTISIPIQRDCMNQTCVPDLAVQASTSKTAVEVGNRETLSIVVTITNGGEDAYLSTLSATIPEELQYVGFERLQGNQIVSCTSQSSTTVGCDVGNPFQAGTQVRISIQFSTDNMPGNRESVLFSFRVASVDRESNIDDNEYNVTIPLLVRAELSLHGSSNPDRVIFAEKDYNRERIIQYVDDIGPEVTHIFALYNNGPSNIGDTTVTIPWPVRYSDASYLLYPMGASMDTGEECTIQGGWNPESYFLNSTRSDVTSSDSRRRRRMVSDDVTTPSGMTTADLPSSTTASPDGYRQRNVTCAAGGMSPYCADITCTVGLLGAGINAARNNIVITVRSRVWTDTLTAGNVELSVFTQAQTSVSSVSYITPLTDPIGAISDQVTTSIVPQLNEGPVIIKEIPLWIYLVSALGGVIILLVIVGILYRCGFFKRKKIGPEEQEIIRSNTISKSRRNPGEDNDGMDE